LKTGVWSDQTVWSNNSIPTDTTNILLSYDIVIDINATCKSLNTNSHEVTVNSGFILNVLGDKHTAIDIDGNVYNTVTIATQVWMKENLNVSHYKNGDSIPEVKDFLTWTTL